jgi:hypothetical protein
VIEPYVAGGRRGQKLVGQGRIALGTAHGRPRASAAHGSGRTLLEIKGGVACDAASGGSGFARFSV